MTKIMTTIIAFDLIKEGRISLDEKFFVSENAWRLSQSGYSSMFIMINDTVTIEELLKGIIVVSGNDACVALAEAIAGSEETFAELMNVKSKEIGLINDFYPKKRLEKEVTKLAKKIASKSNLTIKIGKQAFYKQLEMPLKKAYSYTSRMMTLNMMAKDAHEGISAFIEKRKPKWKNK